MRQSLCLLTVLISSCHFSCGDIIRNPNKNPKSVKPSKTITEYGFGTCVNFTGKYEGSCTQLDKGTEQGQVYSLDQSSCSTFSLINEHIFRLNQNLASQMPDGIPAQTRASWLAQNGDLQLNVSWQQDQKLWEQRWTFSSAESSLSVEKLRHLESGEEQLVQTCKLNRLP